MAARPEKAEEVRVSSWQVDEKIVSGGDPLFAKELLRSRHGERDLDARNQSNATLLSQATTQPSKNTTITTLQLLLLLPACRRLIDTPTRLHHSHHG